MNKILTSYDLQKPYSTASIIKNEDGRLFYLISEPEMSDEKCKLFQKILSLLNDSLNPELFDSTAPDSKKRLQNAVSSLRNLYSIHLSEDDINIFNYYAERDFYGFSAVQPFLEDPNIEDISCSGNDIPIHVFHRKYGSIQTNVTLSESETNALIQRMAQCSKKQISVAEPMTDAVLPDGSRVQLTLGSEITTKGSTFTIRKFNEKPFSPSDLVKNGTFTPETAAYLWLCVESNMNLIFAGGTASGKTTSLNAFCQFIPENKKIVSIEDTREINLPHLNWISAISREKNGNTENNTGRITLYDLLKASLRQRPEFILVGEVRGAEAYVLFQAMSTGHTTISTMHAESVDTLIHRLENPPMNVPRVMIQTLDILVILAQTENEGRFSKKCLAVYEILETDPQTSEILTIEIFNHLMPDSKPDLEKSAVLKKAGIRKGWTAEKLKEEFERRVLQFQKSSGVEPESEVLE